MNDSQALLADYVTSGSESAFRELVSLYVDLVYSTAVRLLDGDAHLAEDVTQTVFVNLARRAPALPTNVMLGGWLHRDACFVAAGILRRERRRKSRERQAVEMNALDNHSEANLALLKPVLDEAINSLGTEDRLAIVLRFFEKRDLRAVGDVLGASEDAAQKRVSRALEKMRVVLKRRGIASSAAALGTVLATETVTAAPAGLAANIAGAALATVAAGAGTTGTLLKLMTMTKLKAAILSAVILAAVTTPLAVQQHQERVKLREENENLRQQITRLQSDYKDLSNLLAQAQIVQQDDKTSEIARLRGELTKVRRKNQELAMFKAAADAQSLNDPSKAALTAWVERASELKKRLDEMPDQKIPELQLLQEDDWLQATKGAGIFDTEDNIRAALGILRHAAKIKLGGLLSEALANYVQANNGMLPTVVSQLKPYLGRPAWLDPNTPYDEAIFQRYAMVHTGHINEVAKGEWLVKEIAPPITRPNESQNDLPLHVAIGSWEGVLDGP